MWRLITILFICGCGSSNGHVVKQSPTDPFWCIALSGSKLRPVDGRNACERTLAECQRTRHISRQAGFQASHCTGHSEAVCMRVRFPDEPIHTLCFADGEECSRVEASIPDTAELFPCAIESAD